MKWGSTVYEREREYLSVPRPQNNFPARFSSQLAVLQCLHKKYSTKFENADFRTDLHEALTAFKQKKNLSNRKTKIWSKTIKHNMFQAFHISHSRQWTLTFDRDRRLFLKGRCLEIFKKFSCVMIITSWHYTISDKRAILYYFSDSICIA